MFNVKCIRRNEKNACLFNNKRECTSTHTSVSWFFPIFSRMCVCVCYHFHLTLLIWCNLLLLFTLGYSHSNSFFSAKPLHKWMHPEISKHLYLRLRYFCCRLKINFTTLYDFTFLISTKWEKTTWSSHEWMTHMDMHDKLKNILHSKLKLKWDFTLYHCNNNFSLQQKRIQFSPFLIPTIMAHQHSFVCSTSKYATYMHVMVSAVISTVINHLWNIQLSYWTRDVHLCSYTALATEYSF